MQLPTLVDAHVGGSKIGAAGALIDSENPAIFNGYGLRGNFGLGDVFNIGGWVTYIDGDTFVSDKGATG